MAEDTAGRLLGLAQGGIERQEKQTSGAIDTALGVAQQMQNVQAQRERIEQQKQQLQVQKMGKILDTVEIGLTRVPKASKKSFFKNFLRNQAGQIGVNISDEFIEGILSPDINQGGVGKAIVEFRESLRNDIRGGQGMSEETLAQAQEIEAAFGGDVSKLGSFMTSAFGQEVGALAQEQRQERGIVAKREEKKVAREATADVEEAKKTANDFVKFTSGGGFAGISKKLTDLGKAINVMKTGKVDTGGIGGFFKSILPEQFTAVVAPEEKAVLDVVRGAISIKGQLDSQFSAKEAQIQFGRAFDQALPTEKNIEKAEATLNGLKSDILVKLKQFERQKRISPEEADAIRKQLGSLNISSKAPSSPKAAPSKTLSPAVKKRFNELPANKKDLFIRQLSAQQGRSPEEIKKELGSK